MSNAKVTYPIAAQLYSLRHMPDSLEKIFAQLAAIGYRGVETIGNHNLPAEQMRALLSRYGLQVISTHVSLQALESSMDEILAFNQAIGNTTITVPAVPKDQQPTDADGLRALGHRLAELGHRCSAAGMHLLYHNHAWEMVEIEGRLALDWIMAGAGVAYLQLEPDLAWVVRGGADPLALLRRYALRCPRVHVKDVAPEGENEDEMGFADVGYGTIDWATLLPACHTAGAQWYIVEHDLPKNPMVSMRRSFDFLKTALQPGTA